MGKSLRLKPDQGNLLNKRSMLKKIKRISALIIFQNEECSQVDYLAADRHQTGLEK